MTTANKITILRILLIPFFVVEIIYYVRTGNEVYRLAGVLAFAVSAILDGVDGYVARHYHQQSELGTILDPLADKLLLVSAIILLSFDNAPYLREFPLWLTGLIIGRDVLLAIGSLVVHLVVGKMTVRPRLSGKVATVFQMVAVSWILLRWDFHSGLLNIWIWGAAIFTTVSGVFYLTDWMRQLGKHPASLPGKKSATDKHG
jgi:CDP-diacylglycerol--glycerol-3-phosphate 3-phosphatidyltransferase